MAVSKGAPDNEDLAQQLAAQKMQAAIAGDTPKIYFNSFINTLGNTDIVVVLERNQQPVAVLNASYTTIKSLVEKLGQIVERIESLTGHDIMTGDFIGKKLTESRDAK